MVDRRIRKWLREDWQRALRVDYFPSAMRGHRWAVAGIHRNDGNCVKSTVSGPSMQVALDRFAKSLEVRR